MFQSYEGSGTVHYSVSPSTAFSSPSTVLGTVVATTFFFLYVAGTTSAGTPNMVRLKEFLTKSLNEEVDTLAGECVIGPLPVEDFRKESLRLERFNNHLDLEIWHFNFFGKVLVERQIAVFSDDDDTFL